MSGVNIFSGYKQEEDRFTNGLIAVLHLGTLADREFVPRFLQTLLGIERAEVNAFRVLQGFDGTADAELSGDSCCVHFETKIVSATLREEQIYSHLLKLEKRTASLKKLVLLTPDDSGSKYVRRHLGIAPASLLHLGWKRVYDYLDNHIAEARESVLTELIRQYLARIQKVVFEQDIAGIILKTDFGARSGVFKDSYLLEMRSGVWSNWNTPREYKSLDGTGRKLLLYDRTRKGVTAEVEIRKVERTDNEPGYPWSNEFEPGTLRVFELPIPVERVRSIPGFEYFGVSRKDRSPYRNITHSQYRQLTQEL